MIETLLNGLSAILKVIAHMSLWGALWAFLFVVASHFWIVRLPDFENALVTAVFGGVVLVLAWWSSAAADRWRREER